MTLSEPRDAYRATLARSDKALGEARSARESARAAERSWLRERRDLESSLYTALRTFWRRHLGSGGEPGSRKAVAWPLERRLLLSRLRWTALRRSSDPRLRVLKDKHKENRRQLWRIRRRLGFHRIRNVMLRAFAFVGRNRWKVLTLVLLLVFWLLTLP